MDRAEAAGFGVSIFGHVAIVAIAWVLTFGNPARRPEPSAFEVSFVDEVGLTAASPEPSPSAQASVAPEIAPPEQAAPAPAPVPEPTPAPPRPAPSPAPAPTPRAEAPSRPSPPAQRRQQATDTRQRNAGSLLGPDLLRGIGNDRNARSNRAPAAVFDANAQRSLGAALLRALAPCETQPLPAPEAADIRVRVSVTLDPDGNLVSARVTGVTNDDGPLARYVARMRDLALAVVRQCTPIRGLPPEFYDVPRGWRTFNYTFPRRS